MEIKKTKGNNFELTNGTCFVNRIINMSINELIDIVGYPSTVGSDDSKVQLGWSWKINTKACLTLYDYKQRKSIFEINQWHVGGKGLTEVQIDEVLSIFGFSKHDIQVSN